MVTFNFLPLLNEMTWTCMIYEGENSPGNPRYAGAPQPGNVKMPPQNRQCSLPVPSLPKPQWLTLDHYGRGMLRPRINMDQQQPTPTIEITSVINLDVVFSDAYPCPRKCFNDDPRCCMYRQYVPAFSFKVTQM